MEDEPAPPHSETDEELMRRACGAEPQRLGDLVRRHRLKLLRTAQSRLGSVAAAEDAVQETFLAAFRSRRTYNPAYTVRTWLWTILLNVCKSFWNKRLRTPQQQPWSQSPDGAARSAEQPQGTPGPVEMLLEKERSERLRHALTGLRDDWADALRLRFFAEMKFQEIADVQACSLATAKNRVRWGLERLAELLRDSDGPPVEDAATSDETSTSVVPSPSRTTDPA